MTPGGHGCVLAIVGSTTLENNAEAMRRIEVVFADHKPRLFTSGGAPGIDTMAERVADRLGVAKKIFLPSERTWAGEGGYRARNERVAQTCTCLIRIHDCMSRTYGSGWTFERAQALDKRAEAYIIHTARCTHKGRTYAQA